MTCRNVQCFVMLALCATSCTGDGDATQNQDAPNRLVVNAPAATEPKWLSKEELDKLNQVGDEKAMDDVDALVMLGYGVEDSQRERRLQGGVLIIKTMLHDLYYDVDLNVRKHPSEDAAFYATLVEFKNRIGSRQTGIFSVKDLGELSYYSKLASYVEHGVSPLGLFSVSQMDGYTSAVGSWVIQGERLAAPINVGKIDCWQADRTCTIIDAELQPPSRSSISGNYIGANISHWGIKSWSPSRVVAEQTTPCRRLVLTIDIAAKQVYHVASDLTTEGCPIVGKLGAPRVTSLIDALDVERQHYDEMRKELSKVSNKPYEEIRKTFEAPDAPAKAKKK